MGKKEENSCNKLRLADLSTIAKKQCMRKCDTYCLGYKDIFVQFKNERNRKQVHFENTPIQIYWKFHHPKLKVSDKNSDMFYTFLLKTYIVGTR